MEQFTFSFEGISTDIALRTWKDFHGISLCCIVMNEEAHLKDFFDWHQPYVDNIIVIDGGSQDQSVEVSYKYTSNVSVYQFDGHYGNQKNRAIEKSKNNWTLFMDPDERLSKIVLDNLRNLINQDKYDCYSFPRRNKIDGISDYSHGIDLQLRLFRSYCRYIRPVHEELVGFRSRYTFDAQSGYEILHNKGGMRHSYRNLLYEYFDVKHITELGYPSGQLENSMKHHLPKVFTRLAMISDELKGKKKQ